MESGGDGKTLKGVESINGENGRRIERNCKTGKRKSGG